jgi:hypothetical protein
MTLCAMRAANSAGHLPAVNHTGPPLRYSPGYFRISATGAHGAKVKLMRIYGSNAAGQVANASAPRRAASGGFTVDQGEAPQSAHPTAALRTIGGIDTLLALQGQEDPAERKRRAVKRGRTALDVLDELKLEVLGGTPGPSTLQRLKAATAELSDGSGDERLDSVLAEIELRLEVEIAKMGPRR